MLITKEELKFSIPKPEAIYEYVPKPPLIPAGKKERFVVPWTKRIAEQFEVMVQLANHSVITDELAQRARDSLDEAEKAQEYAQNSYNQYRELSELYNDVKSRLDKASIENEELKKANQRLSQKNNDLLDEIKELKLKIE